MKPSLVLFFLFALVPWEGRAATVDPHQGVPRIHDLFEPASRYEFDALEILRDSYRFVPGAVARSVELLLLHALGILVLADAAARIAPRPKRHAFWAASAMSRMR